MLFMSSPFRSTGRQCLLCSMLNALQWHSNGQLCSNKTLHYCHFMAVAFSALETASPEAIESASIFDRCSKFLQSH